MPFERTNGTCAKVNCNAPVREGQAYCADCQKTVPQEKAQQEWGAVYEVTWNQQAQRAFNTSHNEALRVLSTRYTKKGA